MDTKIFGLSEQALSLCESRSVLLTNNLVNSSTPHYKARDIDFNKALQNANEMYSLKATDKKHINASNQLSGAKIMYRVPNQISLDGNTVDDEMERKNFIENSLRYQVNLTFVKYESDKIRYALKGE
jgi:flagellar basal-body rod protein FlgB